MCENVVTAAGGTFAGVSFGTASIPVITVYALGEGELAKIGTVSFI